MKVKKLKQVLPDGSLSDYIDIGAKAINVDMENGNSIEVEINKKPYYFNNVAEMKNVKLKNGDVVQTLGYYSVNDGGTGTYKIRAKSSSDIEDNGSIHFIGTNLVAELIVENTVNYNQFGAYGDGTHNDIEAIRKTHNFANSKKIDVEGVKTSTYYIGDSSSAVQVKTNTDFKCSKFIIDDSIVTTNRSKYIFEIKRNTNAIDKTGTVNSIVADQGLIPELAGNGNCLVYAVNSNKQDFIRTGDHDTKSKNRQDIFRIDNSGNVLDSIIWDFDQVTKLELYKIEDENIYFKNGIFETKANTYASIDKLEYYTRSIYVERDNTLIDNIKHSIINEEEISSPYEGFIKSNKCSNIRISNCNLQAHKTYYKGSTAMGSYDISNNLCIDVYLENIQQTNSIIDNKYWGIHTSNYCKKMYIDNCKMNRIDAHCGVYYIYIKNCLLGYQGIRFVGGKVCNVENTTVVSRFFVYLRDDYGCSWNGDINIKNCILKTGDFDDDNYRIICSINNGTHDFGFKCYAPNINIDNFIFYNKDNENAYCDVYYAVNQNTVEHTKSYSQNAENNTFPYLMCKKIKLKNLQIQNNNAKGYFLTNKHISDYYIETIGKATNLSGKNFKYPENLNYKYNLYIDIDNCSLGNMYKLNRQYSAVRNSLWETEYSTLNDKTEESVEETHRPVVMFNIKNCDNLQLGIGVAIGTFKVENSNIFLVRQGGEGQTFSYFILNNNTLHYNYKEAPSNSNSCIHTNKICFNNCKFVMDNNYTVSDIRSVEQPFKSIVESNNWLPYKLIVNGCSYWDTIFDEIKSNPGFSSYLNSYGITPFELINNSNFRIIPKKTGNLADRPSATFENSNLPRGFMFYHASGKAPLFWNGENWIKLDGTIQS